MANEFVGLVARSLQAEHFNAVDIGCSGGIDPAWRDFGDRLRVLAVDASLDEVERLTKAEGAAGIEYIAGFAGLPDNHPWARRVKDRPPKADPFPRFSAGFVIQRQLDRLRAAPLHEKMEHNAWYLTRLADSQRPVFVPEMLSARGWTHVDLLKIDVDGPDFDILQSFDDLSDDLGILAARLEVYLCGGAAETENVFHNTDRFMRAHGFELVGLDARTYSMGALPARFATTGPAQTQTGRTYQADAFYARDPAGSGKATMPKALLQPEKLAKLAAIYSLWNQPDSAAEILLEFRTELSRLFDVGHALNLLAAQTQSGDPAPLSYDAYVAAFEANDPAFYPPPWPPITLRRKIAAALRAWRDPNSVLYPVENRPPRPAR